jgi:CopG family nickel-responsive transcriptional regulator
VSGLVRFGVAMERTLLAEFDRRIAARGYENRSEALRDLVRADVTRSAWEGDEPVVATLSVVVEARVADTLALAPAESHVVRVASLRVPLGEGRALDVHVLRGPARALGRLASGVAASKLVNSCELVPASPAPPAEVGCTGEAPAGS